MLGSDVRSIIRAVICVTLLGFLVSNVCEAGTIARPSKSFGGTSFVNGVVPQASDFNGDSDTIYSEFNGNISNANISPGANVDPTKINPDGFTVNVRTVNSAPCKIWEESDQAADLKRWAICLVSGEFRLGTYNDANTLQNNWFTINRANGGFNLGGASGTNVINGPTTFNHTVTFIGATSFLPAGMVVPYVGTTAPSGWLLMDGSSNSCTGASSANANLCTQLISLFTSANYKGTAAATVTVDTTSDEIIHTTHGHTTGDRVHFSSTTTLPAPLSASTVYCIISTIADRYKISTTCGGAAVDITTTGTGTHSDYFNFVTPDTRGRVVLGTGTGSGLTARTIGATGGEETHTLTGLESGTNVHNHGITDPSHSHAEQVENGGGGISTLHLTGGAGGSFQGLGTGPAVADGATISTGTSGTGITINNSTTAPATNGHNVLDPFLVLTYIIKL